ncbi:MAG: TIGR04211 family SH3 domain-containing protein [Porticoccus sp.]
MRTLLKILLVAAFTLVSTTVLAKTVYISDEYRVPLRKSPCPRCSILHRGIKSGTALNLVETNEEGWSHVTTQGGLDGWMPSHYLQNIPTARDRLAEMELKMGVAENKVGALSEELNTLRQVNTELSTELQSVQSTSNEVSSELNTIKKISSNAISINQQNQELLERNGMLQSEIDVLKAANEQLSNRERNTWFLYGVFAVIAGSLLTIIIPRLKRRKRFSEWG